MRVCSYDYISTWTLLSVIPSKYRMWFGGFFESILLKELWYLYHNRINNLTVDNNNNNSNSNRHNSSNTNKVMLENI